MSPESSAAGIGWTTRASGPSRWLLGGIFILSGLAKITDPERFLLTLREFRLLSKGMEIILVLYLPWLEFVLGLSLFVGILYRTSALLVAGLNALFAIAIGSLLARGIEVDCGCFGLVADVLHLPDMADWKAIGRNLFFIGMALFIARSEKSIFSLENYIKKPCPS
jgi:putative oxidoreductase